MAPSIRTRQRLYQLAFQPVHNETGTPYPCDPQHLATYRRLPGPNLQRQVRVTEAALEIVNRNSEYRRREDFGHSEWGAMKRVTDGVSQSAESGWGPDLIIKMFADLDLIFFHGKLLGNVLVRWRVLEPGVLGSTKPFEGNQAGIQLNPKMVFDFQRSESPFQMMFGTMLHEMCVST